MVTYTKY